MAFQVGIVKLTGTFNDISFYHSVFGWLVRTKGGPSRKQFKTSPAFVRSRENSREFIACSKAASTLRRLILRSTGLKDKTLYHRLLKLMRALADKDTVSVRGQRQPLKGMQSEASRILLRNFEIKEKLNLYEVLLANNYFGNTKASLQNKCKLKKEKPVGVKRKQRSIAFIYRGVCKQVSTARPRVYKNRIESG